MPKKKKVTKKDKIEASKEDITGFSGGFSVNLDRKTKSGDKLRDVLSKHVGETLDQELKNQEDLINKLPYWHDQYRGKREPKSFPWANCFAKDTEVLSEYGWMPVGDVRVGDRLLSMNPTDGKSNYQVVTEISCNYRASLKHIYNKTVDFMVTPEHNMAVYHDGMRKKFKFVSAEELNTGHKVPLISKWEGKRPRQLFGFDPFNLLKFVGWYITEGWTYKYKNKWKILKLSSIGIAQSLPARRFEIENLLNQLGFNFSKNKKGFIVSAKSVPWELRKLLASLGKHDEKYIPRQFLDLDSEYLIALMDALLAGDGNITFRYNRNFPNVSYATTSKQLADDVQELAQKIGLRASINIEDKRGTLVGVKDDRINSGITRKLLYRLNILFKKQAKVFRMQIEDVNYNDLVYNFTVPPFHSVYVRRNGKAGWIGQCANVAIPLTRSNTDAIFVRIIDAIFNKVKLWIAKAQKKQFVGFDKELEEQLNWFQKNILQLKKKLFSPLLECVKTGTGLVMIVNEEKHDARMDYATPAELKDPNVKKYSAKGTPSKLVKRIDKTYTGPNIYPIPRSDWVMSSDATSIDDAYMCGYRVRLRKPQIDVKVRQDLYDKKEVEKLTAPDKVDEATERRAEAQGKEIKKTEYEGQYEIWQLHMYYDVDEEGEEEDIVISYHRNTGAILRCIYNPLFRKFRPFQDFVFYPTEYCSDGEGICEILEPLQKVADTLMNQTLDTQTLMNAPWIFVRGGIGLDNLRPSPGKTIPVLGELEGNIQIIQHPGPPPVTFQITDRIYALADRAVGITPAVMGISTAERPVAKETVALQTEANKKFKAGIDNLRDKLSEFAWKLIDFFTQYHPTYEYGDMGKERTIKFPTEYMRDGINIELATSSEMLNQEIRREITLTIYQILSDYMTKIAGMAQMLVNPQVPSGFKKLIIDGNKISVKLLNRLLEDFEIKDAEDLVLDIEKSMDTEKAIQESIDKMPQQPPQGGQGGQGGAPQVAMPPQGTGGIG